MVFRRQVARQVGRAYDFTFQNILNQQPLPLAQFKGKVILLVNTASQCGFTKQYAELEKLYQTYQAQGLVIIGIPSNDFGKQEPGTNEKIATFCQTHYGVSFPLAQKSVVKGINAHPFYLWAGRVLGFGSAPKWNFHKYLIDKEGCLVDYFYSMTSPQSPRLVRAVERLL